MSVGGIGVIVGGTGVFVGVTGVGGTAAGGTGVSAGALVGAGAVAGSMVTGGAVGGTVVGGMVASGSALVGTSLMSTVWLEVMFILAETRASSWTGPAHCSTSHPLLGTTDGTAMNLTPSLDRLGIEKDNRSVDWVRYDFQFVGDGYRCWCVSRRGNRCLGNGACCQGQGRNNHH